MNQRKTTMKKLSLLLVLCALALSACVPQTPDSVTASPSPTTTSLADVATETIPTTEEIQDEAQDSAAPEPTPVDIPESGRQAVTFINSAGAQLDAYFYPPNYKGAPVIVLMHWARGDLSDWNEIAPWLQNAGAPPPEGFPSLPNEISFGVLVFSFSGYGNSPGDGSPAQLLSDAADAVAFAATLPDIDPTRIVAMGASIGSDGSVDGCAALVSQSDPARDCKGALSLSPGNYLGMTYKDAVDILMSANPPRPVYCFAAVNDGPSPATCRSASGEAFLYLEKSGADHGMRLLTAQHPEIPGEIVEFLETALGIDLTP
jgi:dienelactone hydrolase